jgi:hypothetical protein
MIFQISNLRDVDRYLYGCDPAETARPQKELRADRPLSVNPGPLLELNIDGVYPHNRIGDGGTPPRADRVLFKRRELADSV